MKGQKQRQLRALEDARKRERSRVSKKRRINNPESNDEGATKSNDGNINSNTLAAKDPSFFRKEAVRLAQETQPDVWPAFTRKLWLPNTDDESNKESKTDDLRSSLKLHVSGSLTNTSAPISDYCPLPLTSFDDSRLPASFARFLATKARKFTSPTPVQAQAWPAILAGLDVLAISPTGTGKSLAFLLPAAAHILAQSSEMRAECVGPIALVLAPTRELAIQLAKVCRPFAKLFNIPSATLIGGQNRAIQTAQLRGRNVKGSGALSPALLAVGTPGRVVDLAAHGVLSLVHVQLLVLDEADRMLAMGFEADLCAVTQCVRKDRQTVMTSATFATKLRQRVMSLEWLQEPVVVISVDVVDIGQAPSDSDKDEENDIEMEIEQGHEDHQVPDETETVEKNNEAIVKQSEAESVEKKVETVEKKNKMAENEREIVKEDKCVEGCTRSDCAIKDDKLQAAMRKIQELEAQLNAERHAHQTAQQQPVQSDQSLDASADKNESLVEKNEIGERDSESAQDDGEFIENEIESVEDETESAEIDSEIIEKIKTETVDQQSETEMAETKTETQEKSDNNNNDGDEQEDVASKTDTDIEETKEEKHAKHLGGASSVTVGSNITQTVHVCSEHKKPRKLMRLMTAVDKEHKESGGRQAPSVIVFCSRIKAVLFVAHFLLKSNVTCATLHGQMPQEKRDEAMYHLRAGKVRVLVATDVAARGIHIANLSIIVNYDFPPNIDQYLHRIGRSGRGGIMGNAYSFFTRNMAALAPDLVRLLERSNQYVDPNLAQLAVERTALSKPVMGQEQPDGYESNSSSSSSGSSSSSSSSSSSDDEDEDEDDDAIAAPQPQPNHNMPKRLRVEYLKSTNNKKARTEAGDIIWTPPVDAVPVVVPVAVKAKTIENKRPRGKRGGKKHVKKAGGGSGSGVAAATGKWKPTQNANPWQKRR